MASEALKAAATGVVASTEHPYKALDRQLENSRGEFAKLLGRDIPVDRFIRTVKNAVLANPELLDADRPSLISAAMRAAQDQLIPDGREAVFNIYNTKRRTERGDVWEKRVQYLPMVQGMIKRLYQSGNVTYVDAVAVFEADVFEYERGDNPRIVHKPSPVAEPGAIVAAYAIFKLENGEVKREVMFRRDIEKVRAASKASDGPGWTTWEDQFAIKSVLKRAYKQLPYHPAIDSVVEADNAAMGLPAVHPSAAVPPPALEQREPATLERLQTAQERAPEPVVQESSEPPSAQPAPAGKPGALLMTDEDVRRIKVLEWVGMIPTGKGKDVIAAWAEEREEYVRASPVFAKAIAEALKGEKS